MAHRRYETRAVYPDDDLLVSVRESMDVLCWDDEAPTDTGLVDMHGTRIFRVPVKHPVGFCR